MNKYTLLELNEFIKRVVALNLPEPVWINCEISQAGRSRGIMYLDLIQKDEVSNQVLAQSKAMLWSRDYKLIKKRRGEIIDEILTTGQSVLLQVKPEFSERYGLTLMIEDVDTTFTLGALALKRQQTLERLFELGLIGKNKTYDLPLVIQRIAIISSETAAGYQDFVNQLAGNELGFKFKTELFSAAMQGERTEEEVVDALRIISNHSSNFDVAIIIRGGGAKLDLAAFDHFNIGKAIANTTLPVLTGIGHEIDESIADLVAHTPLKTPTAVADFIINHNAFFENGIEQLTLKIIDNARFHYQGTAQNLQNLQQQLQYVTLSKIKDKQHQLDVLADELPKKVQVYFKNQQNDIESLEKSINLLNPERILKRGFTLTLKDGKVVKSVNELKEGDVIETILENGKRKSKVL